MPVTPSGRQYDITHGDQHATIVEVGGGIRQYERAGRAVLDPYPVEAICDGAHGAVLAPWPNRLADGRYRFKGVDYQVALTEPEKHNAIHGFFRWRPFQVIRHERQRIIIGARLYPCSGYPFALDLQVDYELADNGLHVAITATNIGDKPCPYACGQHPYLSPGTGSINDCSLQFTAKTRIVTDTRRQLPIAKKPVAGSPYDFSEARPIGPLRIDAAFTDLTRDHNGIARASLTTADGRRIDFWQDQHFQALQVYTGDTLAPERQRRGLAIEPMTCVPNGLQTGEGLVTLMPGQSLTACWGVSFK